MKEGRNNSRTRKLDLQNKLEKKEKITLVLSRTRNKTKRKKEESKTKGKMLSKHTNSQL